MGIVRDHNRHLQNDLARKQSSNKKRRILFKGLRDYTGSSIVFQ